MVVAIYLLQSVLPVIYCLHRDVARFQDTNKNVQAPNYLTKNVLVWMPETRHARLSSNTTSRTVETISLPQNVLSSTERKHTIMPETPLKEQLRGEHVNAAAAPSVPVRRVPTTDFSNLTATGRSQDEPFLNLTKLQHIAQYDEEMSSSILSALFLSSRIKHRDHKLSNIPSRKCQCENLTCDCSDRLLTSVPQNLPVDITELLLDRNHLESLTKNSFSSYRHLKVLDMSINYISLLESGTFLGLDELTRLDLSSNSIGKTKFPTQNLFEPLRSLKYLRMDVNQFPCSKNSSYFGSLLSYLGHLEELQIDSHGEQYFDLGFKNLTSLQSFRLSCSYCTFSAINNLTFENLGQVKTLNISDCHINGTEIEYGAFSHFTQLQTLDISRNPSIGLEHLPRVMYGLRNSSLQTLVIDNIVDKYSRNVVNTSMTQYLPQTLTTLFARGNRIVYVDHQVMKTLPQNLQKVDISDNDIIANPMTLPLADIKQLETLVINNINEECPITVENKIPQSLQNLLIFQMQTTGKKRRMHISEQISTIPLKLKRVEMSITKMDYDYVNSISEDNNVEELDLSCSYFPTVQMDSFARLPKLRYLNLRSSFIRKLLPPASDMPLLSRLVLQSNYIDYSTYKMRPNFIGLPNLTDLDLSLNQMTVLTQELFQGIDKLEFLRLSGNLFTDFVANISHLQQLKLLNLSNTGLPCLPELTRTHINQLTTTRPGQIQVDMSDCPIQCDCFNLDFLKWMTNSQAFDKSFTRYKCRYPDTSIKYINDGYKHTLRLLTRECAQNYPMYLVIIGGTLIVFFLMLGMVIYRFRWKIRYLYYAAYLKVVDEGRKNNDDHFVYDVFISYDSEDSRFVQQCLLPELQHRDLVLLDHGRDFLAGTSIPSNIVMAVAESRKTLVVLTRNLIGSYWCNYEIQMATGEAVHTGRQVLVFLLKENIPNRELDVELLRYIKNNTYLPYPSPEDEGDEEIMKKFYDKLAHDLKS